MKNYHRLNSTRRKEALSIKKAYVADSDGRVMGKRKSTMVL